MSIILQKYDVNERKEYSWYNSSNVLYSICIDVENDLKQLIVVFKNGSAYCYKDVDVNDYLLFSRGGLDGSQGKSLNKYIKPKYECEKINNFDIDSLKKKLDEFINNKVNDNTYFISGHRDLTSFEFDKNYAPLLSEIAKNDSNKFVIGDYEGADILSQEYLINVLKIDPCRITIYHMGETPNKIHPEITNIIGGFNTDEERDCAMTNASIKDIAFVRDNTKWSGTAQNILRRFLLKK